MGLPSRPRRVARSPDRGGPNTAQRRGPRPNAAPRCFSSSRGSWPPPVAPRSPAQIHAAISYYYDHPDEIEATFAEDDDAEAGHERRKADHLAGRAAE